jgi:hypothetical protein
MIDNDKLCCGKHLSDSGRHSAQLEDTNDPATPEQGEPTTGFQPSSPKNPMGLGHAGTELQHQIGDHCERDHRCELPPRSSVPTRPSSALFYASGRVPIADHDISLTEAIRISSRPAFAISSATLSRGQ